MSTVRYPLVSGRVARVTRQDSCGRPAYGDKAQVTTEGIVTIAQTANYDDGTEIAVTNMGGKKCVSKAAEPELTNLSVDVTFCEVDPDIYTAMTGFPKIVDPITGDTIGFRVNRGIRPSDVRNGLELWMDAQGSQGCEPGGDVPYGYLLWPYLSGGRVGDYTIESGSAVTFSITGMTTNDGSQWAEGPYDVVTDSLGAPAPLQEPVDSLDHQWVLVTTVAPPEPTDGLIPLDDPDSPVATVATAGSPGTWDGIRPDDFTALDASAITASPSTAWTTGQSVILGDGSKANWTGTDWEAGAA